MKKTPRADSGPLAAAVDDEYRLLEETIAHLQAALATLPQRCRPHRGNALFNLALGQLVERYGQAGTAHLFARVQQDLALNQCPLTIEEARDPFRLDG